MSPASIRTPIVKSTPAKNVKSQCADVSKSSKIKIKTADRSMKKQINESARDNHWSVNASWPTKTSPCSGLIQSIEYNSSVPHWYILLSTLEFYRYRRSVLNHRRLHYLLRVCISSMQIINLQTRNVMSSDSHRTSIQEKWETSVLLTSLNWRMRGVWRPRWRCSLG